MEAKLLQLNLPEGWNVDYREEEEYSDGFGWFNYNVYEITPGIKGLFQEISIIVYDDNPMGAEETVQEEVQEYLNSLNLPLSLRPHLKNYVQTFKIGKTDAFCYVEQQPGDETAHLRVVFDGPSYGITFMDAIICYLEGDEEAAAIDFLSKCISF